MTEKYRAIPDGYMTVGQAARKMGVTVRTLQYYDREGLLSPSAESEGGRRLYTHKDLLMLHQIISLKSLGFSLNDIKNRLEIPTQICVLSHITTQMQALQNGAPMDLLFQSIAGSEKGLSAFGTGVNMLAEAKQMMQELGTSRGPNQLYFETGQGSELSSSSHNGADQVTMESRCYGLARHFSPYLVNTVVGFIGPEYIYDSKQLTRAALEDNFCGHLHGLPMGCDICYTNHMVADQNDADNLLVLLANAGCHYVIGVPQTDDVKRM